MRITNADEDVVKLGHSYIADGNVKWYSHSGKRVWQFLLKIKHGSTIHPSNCTAGHLSYVNEDLSSHKSL